jgi:ST7 protein
MTLRKPEPALSKKAKEKAQELIFDAWEARTHDQRTALARKALSLNPLAADAYVILALDAEPGSDEQLELYHLAYHLADAAIQHFREDDDPDANSWGSLDARPYHRARYGFALTLHQRRDYTAISHFRDLLRLDPRDGQGIRYSLAVCFLETNRDRDLVTLLKEYEEDSSSAWAYTNALAKFRQRGDTSPSRELLAAATKSNQHVVAYLLGKRKIPSILPEFFSPGSEDEAQLYAADKKHIWHATPGARDWLRRNSKI